MAARVPAPTPQEIAERSKAIRAKWTDSEKKKKCVYDVAVRYAPVAETIFSDTISASSRRLQKLY